MSVTWIGNTNTSQLKTNYDSAMTKIDSIKTALENNNCDTTVIDNIIAQIDDMITKSLGAVSAMVNKITNVMNCVTAVDPDTHSQALNSMSGTMNDILSGKPLTSTLSQLDSILDGIANKTCDEITDAVNNAISTVSSIADKVNNATVSISATANLENNLTQALAKAAGLINCIKNALKNDQTGMAQNIETIDTSMAGVVVNIKASLDASVNDQDILEQSKTTIASNLNIAGSYQDLINNTKDLFS